MTLLKTPVRRETASYYRGRALMLVCHPRHLEIREKARRDVVSVDYLTLYEFALKLRWRKLQQEKKQARRKA